MPDAAYKLDDCFFADPLDFEVLRLSQIGRLFARRTTVINEHKHTDLFELTVVTAGKGTVFVNGVPLAVRAGDICINFPGDKHRIESDAGDPLRFDFMAFTVQDEGLKNAYDALLSTHARPEARLFRDERVSALVGDALNEIHSKGEFSLFLSRALFVQILVRSLRALHKIPVPALAPTNAELLCESIMHHIDSHLYSMHSLNELASVTGYSYGYLSALFKRTTGTTLSSYFHTRRLEEVRTLLAQTVRTVTDIADALNYASVYALSRAFREQYGISPREYRKSL